MSDLNPLKLWWQDETDVNRGTDFNQPVVLTPVFITPFLCPLHQQLYLSFPHFPPATKENRVLVLQR